jgi:hypothetical protein
MFSGEENAGNNKTKRHIMIYIGFSTRTHRLYARILCKKYKHCAPVIIKGNKCYLYQFVNKNNISVINLKPRDLLILQKYGWIFIKYDCIFTENIKASNCVQFIKKACGINNRKILTPYDLFKYLK